MPSTEDLEDVFRYLVEVDQHGLVPTQPVGSTRPELELRGALPLVTASLRALLRVIGILAPASLAVFLGALARGDDDALRATTEIALGDRLGIVVPLSTAWLATSSVGDLVEDRLLVYLWLKPVPRWQLPRRRSSRRRRSSCRSSRCRSSWPLSSRGPHS